MTITLRQICLVAADLEAQIADFEAVFGLSVCFVDEGVGVFGLKNALMPIGANLLEIVCPVQKDTAAGRYLKRRGGDGGYMVITQASSPDIQADAKARAKDLGIRTAWERAWPGNDEKPDSDSKPDNDNKNEGGHDHPGNFLQFHPADTGGAFFELDWNAVNDPVGYWPPANGNGWQDKINRSLIGDLVAVELQADDPGALAQKWSALSGLPLEHTEANIPTITFGDTPETRATLRFVPATDGRGDGLGGLDVTCPDLEKVLGLAKARGLATVQNADTAQVIVCGTRFNLIPT